MKCKHCNMLWLISLLLFSVEWQCGPSFHLNTASFEKYITLGSSSLIFLDFVTKYVIVLDVSPTPLGREGLSTPYRHHASEGKGRGASWIVFSPM